MKIYLLERLKNEQRKPLSRIILGIFSTEEKARETASKHYECLGITRSLVENTLEFWKGKRISLGYAYHNHLWDESSFQDVYHITIFEMDEVKEE